MSRGKYILFEGIDGSGKSTIANCVANTLRDRGDPVATLAFPSRRSPIGGLIRDVLEGVSYLDLRSLLWLFIAEHADMEPKIEKMLEDGVSVICDRHVVLSANVYQGSIHGRTTILDVLSHASFRCPDKIYIIDVPACVSVKRRKSTCFIFETEDVEKIESMRRDYSCVEAWPFNESMKDWKRALLLDGVQPIEDIVGKVLEDLNQTTEFLGANLDDCNHLHLR